MQQAFEALMTMLTQCRAEVLLTWTHYELLDSEHL